MATQREAELVRRRSSDLLLRLGAHSIAVDRVKRNNRLTFAVIATFKKRPKKPLPRTLEARDGAKTVKVPLAVRIGPPSEIEGLGGDRPIR